MHWIMDQSQQHSLSFETFLRVLIRTIFDIQSEISEVDFLFLVGVVLTPMVVSGSQIVLA